MGEANTRDGYGPDCCPPAPPLVANLLALAASLWLAEHGKPASYGAIDAHFVHHAEQQFWASAGPLQGERT